MKTLLEIYFFESQNKSRVNAEYKIKKQQESKLIIIHL